MSIDELTKRILEIDAELEALEKERGTLRQARAEIISPFNSGDIIKTRRDKKFIVIRIIPGSFKDKSDLICCLIKKDGTPGKQEKIVYYWDNPEKVDE